MPGMPELELGAAAGVQQVRRDAPDADGTRRARWRPASSDGRADVSHALYILVALVQAAPQSKVDMRLNHAVGLDSKGYTTANRAEKRTGHGGGFKEFDDEEDNLRKRRAHEAHAEKEERKAEKKKCEFWCAPHPHSLFLPSPSLGGEGAQPACAPPHLRPSSRR